MRWPWLTRLFPFLRWFPLRADLIAGLTALLREENVFISRDMAFRTLGARLSGSQFR